MRKGLDYSWARPDPAAVLAAGYTFACRYVSNDRRASGTTTKLIDLAEATALTRAGLDIVLVWEGRAADRDPLKGFTQGQADARDGLAQALAAGAPSNVALYFAVDWQTSSFERDMLEPYFAGALDVLGDTDRVGVYGSYEVVRYLLDSGRVGLAWQTYAWSGRPTVWDTRAQLRQVLNGQTVAGASVDLDEAWADAFGQWRVNVTTAPTDLKAVQAYCQTKTGLPWASLGIIGDENHFGGYHHGKSMLVADDYSRGESARDGNPTESASAFDLGGGWPRFRELTLTIVAACTHNDPMARDIREVIYTPDGSTVKRWDRLGKRNTGDSSHLTHTHISFFRDSEGRRGNADNFLGLIKNFFEGAAVVDMPLTPTDIAAIWNYAIGGPKNRREAHYAISDLRDMLVSNAGTSSYDGQSYGVVNMIRSLSTTVAGLKAANETQAAATIAAVTAISDMVRAGGGNVESAAIVAAIESATAAAATTAMEQAATIDRLQSELTQLRMGLRGAAAEAVDGLADRA